MLDHINKKNRQTVAVACADDSNVLEAVRDAVQKGIADFVLYGDKESILSLWERCPVEIIHEPDMPIACRKAVESVSSGKTSAVMKGKVDTSIIMKAVLDKDFGMRTGNKLSHVAVFELPTYHKLLFLTDAAINISPDFDTMKQIIENAIKIVKSLDIEMPKVALLAAKEKADPKMPATMQAAELARALSSSDILIDGPLALDNAISKESAKIKNLNSPVAGDADILVCPNIESANILYKSLAFLANARVGGIVAGALRPVILTSRADSAESKLLSIMLAVLS